MAAKKKKKTVVSSKKATTYISDILKELRNNVNIIASHIKNVDSNTKLILNRLKEINDKLEGLNSILPAPINETVNSDIQKQPVKNDKPAAQSSTNIAEQSVATGMVPVSQKVLYEDGNPAAYIQVEIYNTKGFLERQTRTNANGTWIATLGPGKYRVALIKRNPNGPKPFQINRDVLVSNDNKELEEVIFDS